ncbi:MAG: tetratricopeptide repeat protein [Bacteroidota bacterium]
MIIIHKVDNFLGELFPRYKSSGYDQDILKEELTQYYTYKVFRPIVDITDGYVTINIDTQRIENEVEEYKAVVRLCEQGQYSKAKPRLQSLIKQNPSNSEYHRILGQIFSDEGDQEQSIDNLIDALRWNPKNTNALTMMGNIMKRHKNDISTAIMYFNQVILLNPDDYIGYNNLGANQLESGKIEEAKQLFEKAYSIKPDYPNTLIALAMISEMKGEQLPAFQNALNALKNCAAKDGVYKQAYNLTLRCAKSIIESGVGLTIFNTMLHQVEYEADKKIEIVVDDTIKTIAKMELAENYNRENHVIRYKPSYPAKEHLMMHELMHIKFVIDARKEESNKVFASTELQKADFIAARDSWAKKMIRSGMTEESVNRVLGDIFAGLNLQVYNAPIDLFIEDFLFNTFPDLRPFQFLSIFNIVKEGIEATTMKNIVDIMPKDILQNSKIYNLVGALQFKDLYGIDFIKEFNPDPFELKTAQRMYNEYLDYKDDRSPAEEYELIENWAKDLKLDNNFILIDEIDHFNKKSSVENILKTIEDDPYDLKGNQKSKLRDQKNFIESQKDIGFNSAVMFFMVDALQFFKEMPLSGIKKIAIEIAMLGTQGIRPDAESYKLTNIPNKVFSGYHLLAYYYVSWALTDTVMLKELNLPFSAEYEMAKGMAKGE